MARIEFKGIEEYSKRLAKLGAASLAACKYAVYPGASIVIEAIKDNTPVKTGDLKNSITLTPMTIDSDGFIYTKVAFAGYDRKGRPNVVKARTLESGRSKKNKHPFVRPAVRRVEKAAEFAMEEALNEKLNELMK